MFPVSPYGMRNPRHEAKKAKALEAMAENYVALTEAIETMAASMENMVAAMEDMQKRLDELDAPEKQTRGKAKS